MMRPKQTLVHVEMSFWVAVDEGAEKLLNGGEESLERAAEAAYTALCDRKQDTGNPKFLLRRNANHYTVKGA